MFSATGKATLPILQILPYPTASPDFLSHKHWDLWVPQIFGSQRYRVRGTWSKVFTSTFIWAPYYVVYTHESAIDLFWHPGHKWMVTLDLLYFHHVHMPTQNETMFVVLTAKVHIEILKVWLAWKIQNFPKDDCIVSVWYFRFTLLYFQIYMSPVCRKSCELFQFQ